MSWIFWLIGGIVLLLLIALLVCGEFLFRSVLKRDDTPRPEPTGIWKEIDDENRAAKEKYKKLPHEAWSIQTRDGLTLRAVFLPNPKGTDKIMLGIHGYHCNGLDEYIRFADFYMEQGFSILLPDNRAHGKSDGKYIGFGWLDRLDIIAWAEELVRRLGPDISILLHGISMGSAAVLCASGEDTLPRQVRGITADCGYVSAWEEFRLQLKVRYHLPAFPVLYFASLACRLSAGWFFGSCSPVRQVAKARIPILFVHGDRDDFVPTAFVHPLYEACPSDKELLLIPGAGHALSYQIGRPAYEAAILRLIEKAIPDDTDRKEADRS